MASAMNLQHYDVDSLAFFSTDIVIARIASDGKADISATVMETLSGALKPRDRITDLNPFLGPFFKPLPDGAKVVLFLDSRSRARSFFSDANRAKYAVPPSGVYLIDSYDHVHEYFQQSNPGPYIAEGYHLGFLGSAHDPTEQEDLKYPSLADVKARIAAAVARVAPVRSRLDREATPADIPFLLHLVDLASQDASDCDLRLAPAIAQRAMEKLRALHDPEVLLRAVTLSGNTPFADVNFIEEESGNSNPGFTQSRVAWLMALVANRQAPVAQRRTATSLLISLSGWGEGKDRGVHNSFLNSEADRILALSKRVFDDDGEDPQLRGLCLQFLDLKAPANVADVRRVYRKAHADELRFAIEKALASESADLFASLHPPGGPVASRVFVPPLCGCAQPEPGKLQIREEYEEPQAEVEAMRSRSIYIEEARPMMIRAKTGLATKIDGLAIVGGWSGESDGQFEYSLPQTTTSPPGRYKIALQMPEDGQMRTGYGIAVTVRATAAGNQIEVDELVQR
jgi:hypothetical protein